MKEKLLSMTLMLFVAMLTFPMMSQTQWKAPKWEKFVRIDGNDINLRKGPGTNYGKLYINDNWSTDVKYDFVAKKGYRIYHPDDGTFLPVIDETEGWYHIYLNIDIDAYVSKKYCTVFEPTAFPFTPNYPGGKYQMWHSCSPSLGHELYVGRRWGLGVLSANYGDDDDAIEEVRTKFGTDGGDDMFAPINVDKASDTYIEQFIQTHQPREGFDFMDSAIGWSYMLNYKFLNIETSFGFDPNKYKFEMITAPLKPIVITKLVKARNGNGLNLLKEPRSNGTKLVYVMASEQDFESFSKVTWDQQSYKRSSVTPVEMPICAVIGEQGDYYQVYYSTMSDYNMNGTFVGFVAKSACVDAEVPQLKESFFNDGGHQTTFRDNKFLYWNDFGEIQTGYIKSGKYAVVTNNLMSEISDRHVKVLGIREYDDDILNVSGSQYIKKNQYGSPMADFSKLTNSEFLKLINEESSPAIGVYLNLGLESPYYFDLTGYQCREIIFDVK